MSVSLERPPASRLHSAGRTLRRIARAFARDPHLTDELPVDDQERTWLRLDTAPGVAAWVIRWPAGTSTGWHDHIGENGGVRGTFASSRACCSSRPGPAAARCTAGSDRAALRSFGPSYVHDVTLDRRAARPSRCTSTRPS